MDETHKGGILIDAYLEILNKTGWYHTHIIQAPLSSQRFSAGVVSAMQKRNILGMMQLRYLMPAEMSEEIKPKQYVIFKIALPEKKHLIWNQSSYLLRLYTDLGLLQILLLSSLLLEK